MFLLVLGYRKTMLICKIKMSENSQTDQVASLQVSCKFLCQLVRASIFAYLVRMMSKLLDLVFFYLLFPRFRDWWRELLIANSRYLRRSLTSHWIRWRPEWTLFWQFMYVAWGRGEEVKYSAELQLDESIQLLSFQCWISCLMWMSFLLTATLGSFAAVMTDFLV